MATVAGVTDRPETAPYVPAAMTATTHRSAIATVLRWLPVVLVFCLTLELACRVEDWVIYRMPIFSRFTDIEELVVVDADGMHGRPTAQFERWKMNGLGLRGPETSVAPRPGTRRVITVGASETFGLHESSGMEYPRQLEDSIGVRIARGECPAEASTRFEVLNAGFAGMGLPTIDQDIRNRLRRLRPDFIFVYPSPAQYLDERPPAAARPDSSGRPSLPPLRHAFRPRAVARVRQQLKLLLPERLQTFIRSREMGRAFGAHPPDWRFSRVPPDRMAQFEQDLRRLVGTIRIAGAEPILATHANSFMRRPDRDVGALIAWEKFYPRATGETLIAFDSLARFVTLRVAADSGVTVVDAAQRLATSSATVFSDFVHFTDLGSSHMADIASAGVIQAERRSGRCGNGSTSANDRGRDSITHSSRGTR